MTLSAFPHADPLNGLIGGLLIGLAAATMLLGAGRIAGVSGLLARGLGLSGGTMPRGQALTFLLGLPLGAGLVALLRGGPALHYAPLPIMLLAGLLVGFGTRMGSGCTSGHGVCGMSRLSPRSLAATGLFMAAGFVTVALLRQAGMLS